MGKPAGGPIVLTVDTSKMKTMARKWNIKITQISCSSPERAPAGCLQFYNETSGTIRSFNFKSPALTEVEGTRRQRQLPDCLSVSDRHRGLLDGLHPYPWWLPQEPRRQGRHTGQQVLRHRATR